MVNPIQCNCNKTTKGLITMLEEIITSKEVKFNNLEKKVYKFVCFFGCLIIKLMLEAYDRKLMENRDKKKYRHKGLRETSVNTVMGEIKYKRVMYEIQEEGITKTVYLLDETLKISVEGKVSSNLVEKVIETVPVTDSYRKAEEVIDTTTNTSLCHEKIREIILKIGDKITNKEKEERKLFDKNQLVAGLKEVTALFEEAFIYHYVACRYVQCGYALSVSAVHAALGNREANASICSRCLHGCVFLHQPGKPDSDHLQRCSGNLA